MNIYAEYAKKLTPEAWDQILGPYISTELEKAEAERLWNEHLQYLHPVEHHNSLHVLESVYIFEEKRYSCLWAIGSDVVVPRIDLQTKRTPTK